MSINVKAVAVLIRSGSDEKSVLVTMLLYKWLAVQSLYPSRGMKTCRSTIVEVSTQCIVVEFFMGWLIFTVTEIESASQSSLNNSLFWCCSIPLSPVFR